MNAFCAPQTISVLFWVKLPGKDKRLTVIHTTLLVMQALYAIQVLTDPSQLTRQLVIFVQLAHIALQPVDSTVQKEKSVFSREAMTHLHV